MFYWRAWWINKVESHLFETYLYVVEVLLSHYEVAAYESPVDGLTDRFRPGESLDELNYLAALLAQAGSDAKFGARPLRRAIQRRVEDALSEELIAGRLKLGDQVKASVQNDELVFEKA